MKIKAKIQKTKKIIIKRKKKRNNSKERKGGKKAIVSYVYIFIERLREVMLLY